MNVSYALKREVVQIFLGYSPTLEVSTWPTIYFEERQRYTDLRREHIEEPAEKMNKKEEEDLLDNNPLALSETVNSLYINLLLTVKIMFRIHGSSILRIPKLGK